MVLGTHGRCPRRHSQDPDCRTGMQKAEWTGGEANPRFVVTSLARSEHEARHLYEKVYCARGDMENRIKGCQLDLVADRTSTKTMRQPVAPVVRSDGLCPAVRLTPNWPAAYRVCCRQPRHDPLQAVEDWRLGRVSVRRIKIAMPSACTYRDEFTLVHSRLTAATL